jgi:hypothetical protein
MSDFHSSNPPIPLHDGVPAMCLAVAMFGLVIGGIVISTRMTANETQMAINGPPAASDSVFRPQTGMPTP